MTGKRIERSAKRHATTPAMPRIRRWRSLGMGVLYWLIAKGNQRQLINLLGGPVFFQIYRVATRFGLFSLLRDRPGLTRAEIAQALGLQEEPARILLLGCVSLKLLRKRRERYYCRAMMTRRQIDPEQQENFLFFIEWMHHIVAPSMQYLEESLSEGRAAGLAAFPGDEDNLYGRLEHDAELQRIFYGAMNQRTQRINKLFLERIDFSAYRRVLDVAGGDGQILEQLALRHSGIAGTLLEFSSVVGLAEQRFERSGLSDRLQVQACDMFEDRFPGGYDCILFCHVSANHSGARNRALLAKAFEALDPGGVVCIYSAFANDTEDGPLSAAMLSAYFYCTVSGEGRLYSWSETESWLVAAGFTDIRRVPLLLDHGAILARKA